MTVETGHLDNTPTGQQGVPDIDPGAFVYHLPPGRIARYPLENRDQSRLLVYRAGRLSDAFFAELPAQLPPGSLLVRNNTRVIQARLFFHRQSGARIEVFLLDPVDPVDHQQAFASTGSCSWQCLVGNARKWKEPELQLEIPARKEKIILRASREKKEQGESLVRFSWNGSYSFGELLDHTGIIPIPPYLERETEDIDRERYQTVYSRTPGSVAAPTAGLHFTQKVLDELSSRGIPVASLTLHVGAGTFKPIQDNHLARHSMHTERFSVSRESLEQLLNHRGPLVAVGTTSVRTLESLYWLACRMQRQEEENPFLVLGQWDAYRESNAPARQESLEILLDWMKKKKLDQLEGSTQIMIVPGYRFRMTDGLVTNFHMPRSSLILLVAAFIGKDWEKVYRHALETGYRFLSYGDSSLLLPGA